MSKQNEIQQKQNENTERNYSGILFDLIRQWADEKGIYTNGDLKTQALKLVEEQGELAKAILNNDEQEIIDAIGDCVVVLTNVAELARFKFLREFDNDSMDITIENCLGAAYDTIKSRKGKMENGTFVKDK